MGNAPRLISVARAKRFVAENVSPLPAERIMLDDALHRVLAENVRSDVDAPPFDKAMMDGYAVRSADLTRVDSATSATGCVLRVVGQLPAGHLPAAGVGAGDAMQINTGAPLPDGADSVVRVEDTEPTSDGMAVAIKTPGREGDHVERRGAYSKAGHVVLGAGTRLFAHQIAAAASAGAAQLSVYRQPRVALLVTGDELIDVNDRPTGAQIRNSNGPMLDALVRGLHARPVNLGVTGDDPQTLATQIESGLESDVLCISGGVSMGAFDFVPKVLAGLGVRVVFKKIALKPGKPTLFGVAESGTRVFGLPGNPVGCFVAFWLLVRDALAVLEGRSEIRPIWRARLDGPLPATGDRECYLPCQIEQPPNGDRVAKSITWRGSGDSLGFARANGLIVRPVRAPASQDGDRVEIIPIQPW